MKLRALCFGNDSVLDKKEKEEWLDDLPHNVEMAGAVTRTGWNGDAFNVTFFRSDWTETVELSENKTLS